MLLQTLLYLLPLASLTTALPKTPSSPVPAAVQNARCSQGILPTPKYGTANASFTVCTEEYINAPMQTVYDVLLDFRKYSKWNSFVIDVQLPQTVQKPEDVYIGLSMIFTTQGIVPGANTTSLENVTVLEPPKGRNPKFSIVSWESGAVVQGEHPTSLTRAENGSIRMVSWETYYRPSDAVVLPIRDTLQGLFVQQGRDLKRYCESLGGWSQW